MNHIRTTEKKLINVINFLTCYKLFDIKESNDMTVLTNRKEQEVIIQRSLQLGFLSYFHIFC